MEEETEKKEVREGDQPETSAAQAPAQPASTVPEAQPGQAPAASTPPATAPAQAPATPEETPELPEKSDAEVSEEKEEA